MTRRVSIFNHWAWRGAVIWLTLVALFTLGRLFFLIDYSKVLALDPYDAGELGLVFLSAFRFDASASAYFVAPLLLLGAVAAAIDRTRVDERLRRLIVPYSLLAVLIAWSLVIADHYFYVYFKDHFNVFFWEFWDDFANAHLVMDGVGDEINLPLATAMLGGGVGLGWLALLRHGARSARTEATPRLPALMCLGWVLAFTLALRGTFEPQPLTLQDRREAFSPNRLINLLHTNPLFPLFRSYKDHLELAAGRRAQALSAKDASALFDMAAAFVGATHRQDPAQGFHYLEHEVQPLGPTVLKAKPRHIVIFFMESYSSWPMEFEDQAFGRAITSELTALKKDGLYFAHHFPPGGGTIKNISLALYSLPLPRQFYPSLNYHPEAYRGFPSILPKVMKEAGYRSRFYYGGHQAWHRLYQFLPQIGFDDFFAEHSFPEQPRHDHGLYDSGLFDALHQHLAKATEPTFSFVMSLSNHPPFRFPEGFATTSGPVPESLAGRLLVDAEAFHARFDAFRLSDHALGEFFRKARTEPYFKDTLFVITADHPFGGTVSYPQALGWKEENIPLLFYAPHLMREELKGQVRRTYSTHLDLVPTLAALTTAEPKKIQTWGRNLFAAPEAPFTGINFYFSCHERHCLKRDQLYFVNDALDFVPPELSEAEAQAKKAAIRALEEAYYQSALHYFKSFKRSDGGPKAGSDAPQRG